MSNRTFSEIFSKIKAKENNRISMEDPVTGAMVGSVAAGMVAEAGKGLGKYAADKIKKAAPALLQGERSLSEITKVANVEPRVLLEETLRNLPALDKFFMTMTNLFAAYYLQAVALNEGDDIRGITVLSKLDKFNPNRSPEVVGTLKEAISIAREDYDNIINYGYVLPNFKRNYVALSRLERIARVSREDDMSDLEAGLKKQANQHKQQNLEKDLENARDSGTPKEVQRLEKALNDLTGSPKPETPQPVPSPKERNQSIRNSVKRISDIDNLAVGRMLEVTTRIGDHEYVIPVAVRIRPMSVPSLIMEELITLGDVRDTWTERWHRWRSGELRFFSDLIMQTDRINKRRRLLALDKNGVYTEMIKRRTKNATAAAISGNPSLGGAASFIIITKETAKQVLYRTGGPIESEEIRNLIFAANSAMFIIVVDREWERLQIYTRGITGVMDLSFKQFEGMSKGTGPDIGEIMKAYTLGNNPRF